MKVIRGWKLSSDESYPVMKFTQRWKLPIDESYLVMKVKIVKEVKRSDGLWRFACGDVLKQVPGLKYVGPRCPIPAKAPDLK